MVWERACSRRRHIQHQCKRTHRFREQARSHKGFVLSTNPGICSMRCAGDRLEQVFRADVADHGLRRAAR
ncbi:hypothetical protein C0J56_13855 [Pseudomonas fluorescens]|nr:hypothetical protein C0J56_13855 [Pseudomonas fluorescens]